MFNYKENVAKKCIFLFLLLFCALFFLLALMYLRYFKELTECLVEKSTSSHISQDRIDRPIHQRASYETRNDSLPEDKSETGDVDDKDASAGFSSDQYVAFENNYGKNDDPEYLKFIRNQWIISPSKKPRSLQKFIENGDYSQVWQSPMVDKLLSGKTNGFYVESGAANGEFISNTLFFEIKRNWTGLLVEPNYAFFQELLRTNRNVYASNVCLNTRRVSKKQKFSEHSWWGGIPDQLEEVQKNVQIVTVQCFPLEALLGALSVNHVDYFSLDVEGAELDIVKTIPFDKIVIEVIGLEYRVTSGGTTLTKHLDKTMAKLKQLRHFFNQTGLYKEVGILPVEGKTKQEIDEMGLDVFFQRI